MVIAGLQKDFDAEIITQVLPFGQFRSNTADYLNYYLTNPERPFCKTYIDPKLKILLAEFAGFVDKTRKLPDS